MKDILQDIIANKRIEVERQKQAVRLQTLLGMGGERLEHPARSMRAGSRQHLHRASLLSLREKVLRKAGYIPMLL